MFWSSKTSDANWCNFESTLIMSIGISQVFIVLQIAQHYAIMKLVQTCSNIMIRFDTILQTCPDMFKYYDTIWYDSTNMSKLVQILRHDLIQFYKHVQTCSKS